MVLSKQLEGLRFTGRVRHSYNRKLNIDQILLNRQHLTMQYAVAKSIR